MAFGIVKDSSLTMAGDAQDVMLAGAMWCSLAQR